MRSADTREIPVKAMREAASAIHAAWEAANAELVAFCRDLPRPYRMTHAQMERMAFLKGKVSGLYLAKVEFEKRRPLRFFGSGAP